MQLAHATTAEVGIIVVQAKLAGPTMAVQAGKTNKKITNVLQAGKVSCFSYVITSAGGNTL